LLTEDSLYSLLALKKNIKNLEIEIQQKNCKKSWTAKEMVEKMRRITRRERIKGL